MTLTKIQLIYLKVISFQFDFNFFGSIIKTTNGHKAVDYVEKSTGFEIISATTIVNETINNSGTVKQTIKEFVMYSVRETVLQYTPGAISVQYKKLEPVKQQILHYNCTEVKGMHINVSCSGTVQDKAVQYSLVYTKSDRRLVETNGIR